MKNTDLLETSIDKVEISYRSYSALRNAGFRTIGDVLDVPRSWPTMGLRAFNRIGQKAADEIASAIAEHIRKALAP